ncbi:MAG: hypothetical protein QXY80_02245 [Candidatus Jordarchaeales archaeon]
MREMLSGSLVGMNVLPEGERLERRVLDEPFYEDHLMVGEVTAHAESGEEVDKLLGRARVVEEKYGRGPMLFLVILTAMREAARDKRSLQAT